MFSINKIFYPTVFIFLLQFVSYLKAEQLTIDVIGSSNNQIPIAISQFQNEENFKTVASKVILNDLKSTGLFAINNIENLNYPFDSTEIDFQTLADNGVMHILVGKMELLENKKIKLRFRLYDVPRQKQTLGLSYTISERSIRLASHRISDKIYEEITGDIGIFFNQNQLRLKQG
jgi:TolB protein